jgi:hypothetical protein
MQTYALLVEPQPSKYSFIVSPFSLVRDSKQSAADIEASKPIYMQTLL